MNSVVLVRLRREGLCWVRIYGGTYRCRASATLVLAPSCDNFQPVGVSNTLGAHEWSVYRVYISSAEIHPQKTFRDPKPRDQMNSRFRSQKVRAWQSFSKMRIFPHLPWRSTAHGWIYTVSLSDILAIIFGVTAIEGCQRGVLVGNN
jgi:hypothetical protein